MKKFVEDLKNSLGEFFYDGKLIPLSSEITFSGGRFIVRVCLINHNDLIIKDPEIELVDARFCINNNCEVVSEFIDFPFLGYPESIESDGLSLDESRRLIIETLGTEKTKFIFNNLKK